MRNEDYVDEDYDYDDDCYDCGEDFDCCGGIDFEDPGGVSALRRATKDNPRIYSCPTCGAENTLTPKDVQLGYQCDDCADRAEGYGG